MAANPDSERFAVQSLGIFYPMMRLLRTSLAFIACNVCLGANIALSQDIGDIALPDAPEAVAPPPIDEPREREQSLDRKRKERGDREEKFKKPQKEPTKERNRKLLQEMVEVRPDRWHFLASLVLPIALVRGNRAEYLFEPSTVINVNWRPQDTKNTGQIMPWVGFRMANFAGTGIYENVPGRFGFSYFGPMVGVGRIDPAPASLASDTDKSNTDPGSFLVGRFGAQLAGGVAMISRTANFSAGSKSPGGDLENKPYGFDAPGAWVEATFSWIHFGAVSINALGGVQLGSGKTIAYFGGGFGGTY